MTYMWNVDGFMEKATDKGYLVNAALAKHFGWTKPILTAKSAPEYVTTSNASPRGAAVLVYFPDHAGNMRKLAFEYDYSKMVFTVIEFVPSTATTPMTTKTLITFSPWIYPGETNWFMQPSHTVDIGWVLEQIYPR
jgi:hypothetical protein